MSDEIRRLLEEQARLQRLMDPYAQLRPQMDSASAMYRALGIDSSTKANVQVEAERMRFLSSLVPRDMPSAVELAMQDIEKQKDLLSPLEEAKRLGLIDPTADIRRSLGDALNARSAYEHMFRMPAKSEIERLARDAVDQTSITRMLFGKDTSLQDAMASMHSPWLKDAQRATSSKAFAELIGIGYGIERNDPFDAAFAAALRPALGDWREALMQPSEQLVDPVLRTAFYRERGFDPGLTDFTSEAFDESLRIAGLRKPSPEAPIGEAEPNGDGGAQAALRSFSDIFEFERAVRRFIVELMLTKFGEKWVKQRVPGTTLQGWRDKKEKGKAAGDADLPLIDYADFSDYIKLIERQDNWQELFQPVFGRKEDVQESFRRLGPVRIATMHSRLITQDDQLLLAVETRRVLKAIRAASGSC